MVTQKENILTFNDDLVKHAKSLSKTSAAWINNLRDNSLSRLTDLSLPNRKDEEWRYVNINEIAKNTFTFPKQSKYFNKKSLFPYCDADEIRVVFVNGFYTPEVSATPDVDGVKITSIHDAGENDIDFLKEFPALCKNYFMELNHILSQEGICIQIGLNTTVNKYFHIVHITDESACKNIISPRNIIILKQSSSAQVLESHISFNDNVSYFVNAAMDIYLAENSSLKYYKFQREGKDAYHIGHTRVLQEADSSFENLTVTTFGKLTRNSLDITLNGSGISSTLNGLYAINNDVVVDNHTSIDHRFPQCTSRQLYKGLLADKAHGVFNGKVTVRSEAQQTNSYQLNKNLLLGEDCRMDTKPQLEIDADDVKCSHGATIGQLNEEEIFYLQTRGIAKREAIAILARGFVGEMFNFVEDPVILKKLQYLIEPVLSKVV